MDNIFAARVRPAIEPAKDGLIRNEHAFAFAISTDGVFRVSGNRAVRAPKDYHAAFVVGSESRMKVTSKPAEMGVTIVNADSTGILVRYSDGFVVRKGVAKSLTAGYEIEAAASIEGIPSADGYLLVRWRSHDSGCEYRFTLFRLDGDTLTEAASNVYGCGL